MPIYRYQNALVDEVIVKKNDAGKPRAYLHLKPDANPQAVEHVIKHLTDRRLKWGCVPYAMAEDPNYLEVRGFRKPERLLGVLKIIHATDGNAKSQVLSGDVISRKDRIGKARISIAAAFYFIGDVCYGFQSVFKTFRESPRRWGQILSGIFYSLGTPFAIIYGNDQTKPQLNEACRQMGAFCEAEGIHIAPETALHRNLAAQGKGPLSRLNQLIARHPAETLNVSYGIAGLAVAYDAVTYERMHRVNRFKWIEELVLGLGTAIGGFLAAFVKEKPRDPHQPKRHGLTGVWDWFREKPNRFTGTYFLSTVLHSHGAWEDYKNAKAHPQNPKSKGIIRDAGLRGVFAATNLAAEAALIGASKGHAEGKGKGSTDSLNETIYAIAADMVMHQPAGTKDQIIEKLAQKLSQDGLLEGKHQSIVEGIHRQQQGMEKNAWASAMRHSPVAATLIASPVPSEAAPASKETTRKATPQFASRFSSGSGHRSREDMKRVPDAESKAAAGPAIS
jgi:hypothetical protein